MNEILKELLENDLLQNIVKIVLILLSYMPIKKMSSNYKNANDLGIITPINELIKIIQESIIWFIIILVEGALLAELIPRKIYCNNTLISLIVLTWAITILVLFFFVALKRLGIKLKEKIKRFF